MEHYRESMFKVTMAALKNKLTKLKKHYQESAVKTTRAGSKQVVTKFQQNCVTRLGSQVVPNLKHEESDPLTSNCIGIKHETPTMNTQTFELATVHK